MEHRRLTLLFYRIGSAVQSLLRLQLMPSLPVTRLATYLLFVLQAQLGTVVPAGAYNKEDISANLIASAPLILVADFYT